MSAVIVLILRGVMAATLYLFLLTALIFFIKEMQQSIHQKESSFLPKITLQTDSSSPKPFTQSEILIGRDVSNDLQLMDEAISARHARIFYSGNHWMVEDFQSTNGTYLNNERIILPTTLLEGDILKCGKEIIKISFKNLLP